MIFQLFYKSTSSIGITESDIHDIVFKAKEKNSLLKVTGCLVYFRNEFYQLLEGNREDVLALYEVIKKDKRHFHVSLISEELTEYRVFSNWNMALYYLNEQRNSKSMVEDFKIKIELFNTLNYHTNTGLEFWSDVKKRIFQEKIPDLLNLAI